MPKHKMVLIDPEHAKIILRALESWAAGGTFLALRDRAFFYLLWDGAIRTRIAIELDMDDVVKNPSSRALKIKETVVLPAAESNRYRGLEFSLSERTSDALLAYVKVARRDRWLATPELAGALFISTRYRGEGKRISERTPLSAWRIFLHDYAGLDCDYTLDDIVYTGRKALLEAAGGDVEALAKHANLSGQGSNHYSDSVDRSDAPTARQLMAKAQKKGR